MYITHFMVNTWESQSSLRMINDRRIAVRLETPGDPDPEDCTRVTTSATWAVWICSLPSCFLSLSRWRRAIL